MCTRSLKCSPLPGCRHARSSVGQKSSPPHHSPRPRPRLQRSSPCSFACHHYHHYWLPSLLCNDRSWTLSLWLNLGYTGNLFRWFVDFFRSSTISIEGWCTIKARSARRDAWLPDHESTCALHHDRRIGLNVRSASYSATCAPTRSAIIDGIIIVWIYSRVATCHVLHHEHLPQQQSILCQIKTRRHLPHTIDIHCSGP